MIEDELDTFPVFVEGRVVKGFGRGSKELGCPTANIESGVVQSLKLSRGVFYGFACIEGDDNVYMMVCSFGYNPQYENASKSLEVHILHTFPDDFYGALLRVAICGKIREEKSFPSIAALIEAIEDDKDFARKALTSGDFAEVRAGTKLKKDVS